MASIFFTQFSLWLRLILQTIYVLKIEILHFLSSKSVTCKRERPMMVRVRYLLDIHILWQYRLWRFQTVGTRVLPKNHNQRNLLNFENCINGEVSKKVQKLTFKVNFLCQKLSKSVHFFLLKNINLGAHFLLVSFFDNFNF